MNSIINRNLAKNEDCLISIIGKSPDTIYRHFIIPALNNCPALLVYINGLVDTGEMEDCILAPLMAAIELPEDKHWFKKMGPIHRLMRSRVSVSEVKETIQWSDACDAIVSGDSVLFIDNCDRAFILSNRGWALRALNEPTSEGETRGPKDGFIEDLRTNIASIRRRIKDYNLRFVVFKIGEKTKTAVALGYIDKLVDDSLLEEVKVRLQKIDTDSILASGYLEEFIEDSPYSPFPKIEHTERPDKAAAAILEGRIVILVDNTPFTLIVPTVFWNFIQAPGDYFERYYIGTFWRWLRIIALFLSGSSTSFYVLLTSYHQEMLPTSLALKVAAGRAGVPFPAVVEALFMEVLFEVMTEAGLRMPRTLGQTISILGTVVIGQAAVAAGLVGPALVIAVAIGAISSFAIPSFSMGNAIRLLRFPILIMSATFGIFGYLGALIVICLHLLSLRSFGTAFCSPISPFDLKGQKDTLVRAPRWKMLTRSWLSRPQDMQRQNRNLRPRANTK